MFGAVGLGGADYCCPHRATICPGCPPDYVIAIEQAVISGDPRHLAEALMGLKAFVQIWVPPMNLAALCLDLEHMGRSGTIEGTKEKFSRMQSEFDRVRVMVSAP